MNQSQKLFVIINRILEAKNGDTDRSISLSDRLKEDLGIESFDMVELVVELEDEFGIDIFESGDVKTVNDILEKLKLNC